MCAALQTPNDDPQRTWLPSARDAKMVAVSWCAMVCIAFAPLLLYSAGWSYRPCLPATVGSLRSEMGVQHVSNVRRGRNRQRFSTVAQVLEPSCRDSEFANLGSKPEVDASAELLLDATRLIPRSNARSTLRSEVLLVERFPSQSPPLRC
jgi:hypothetical protein